MTSYTPGPWEWDDCVWDYDPEEQAPWLVQKCTQRPVLLGEVYCEKANAHLIAAAPELYEALDGLLSELDSTPEIDLSSWGISTDDARAALAKARGEQP